MSLIFNQKIFDDIEKEGKKWQEELAKVFTAKPERLEKFSTVSDQEIKRIYLRIRRRHLNLIKG